MESATHRQEIHLETISGPEVASFRVGARGATIGRAAECDICLVHPDVSRQHAAISFDGGSWRLVDLDSRHGTAIDGRRLPPQQPRSIDPGHRIAIGPWQLRVVVEPRGRPGQVEVFQGPASRPTGETYATRQSILLRLREGDTEAREVGWQDFHRRYAPVIRGFARNAGLSPQDAEDVLQEVLLSFFRVSAQFVYDPSRGRFRGYLKRAVLNTIRARWRKRVPGNALEFDPEDDEFDRAEAVWEQQWAEQVVARAIDEARPQFDARTFEAFELYGVAGVPAEAVAGRLEMPVNSVHQAKSRVLKKVREIAERIRTEEG